MMKLLPVLALVFFLGCVGGGNDTNNMVPDLNDSNNSYNDFDAEDYLPNIPIPTGPNGIPNIPISNPPIPVGEDTPTEELTEEEYQALKELPVTENDCQAYQYEGIINDFLGNIPSANAQGVSYEYEGVKEYREYDWCTYNASNASEAAVITHYANPFTHEVWQVVQDDGQTAEMHFEHNQIVEVCNDGVCQPMVFG